MELHVGCAMWSHAPWQGRDLPPPLPQRERLRAYANWCNAVEGNTTFYATPAVETVRSWAAQTSPGFRFVLKLPRPVTHERRLVGGAELDAFLTAIEPLGPRVHALWVQLPPTFSPAGLDALAGFLGQVPREYRYCVEVRHQAFFADPRVERDLERVLGAAAAEWVPFDTTVLFDGPPVSDAEQEAWRKKPGGPPRAATPGRARWPPGCPGAPRRRFSSPPRTTCRPPSWPAASTTTCGPGS